MKGKKSNLGVLAFWFVLITSFLGLTIFVQLKANGWEFNFKTFQIIKTGMISLDGRPDSAKVSVNGKIMSQTLPAKIRNLSPGFYDVKITSQNYQTWEQSIKVEVGKACLFSSIILFLQTPRDATVPSNMNLTNFEQDYTNQAQKIDINGSEIYFQEQLISRFSQNVSSAILYPDNKHIIFQQNDEIRAIDIDGSNNKLLFKLTSPEKTKFIIKNNGQVLYYLEKDKILSKTII